MILHGVAKEVPSRGLRFGLPRLGLGHLAVDSVFQLDLYAVVDVTIVAAFFVVFFNLLVDIVYAYLDPRVRYT